MKLYTFPLSGHAHRAALFLSLVGADHTLVPVDLKAGAHKQPAFLALNPLGQVPVLVDGDVVVPDSNAILVYVATKLGRTDWYPDDAPGRAAVQRWLSLAAGELASGPARARLITVFGAGYDAEATITRAHRLLTFVEGHLDGRTWLVGDRATLADVAFYSYVKAAPEGNVDLAAYPRLRALLERIEALDGFVGFPKTAAGLVA